jgi:iron uptake system EfeUOB component EfeO/EfeM
MKFKVIIPLFVALMLLLSACGSNKSNAITDGSKTMKDTLIELKKGVDASDLSKVKKGADDLETSWKTFEDDVKKKDATLYGKVEDPLHIIAAGAKVDKVDAGVLNKAVSDLNSVLDQVQNLK